NLAGKITRGHEAALTPCGKGTPYVRVAEEEGKILFIGTTLECNTTFHSCEELARLYYHLQPEPTTCEIEEDGRIVKRRMFLHAYGTPRAFAEKERDLVGSGIAKVGLVGRARSVLVDARKMIDYAMQRLERDRLYLVQKGSVSFGCIEECVEFLRKGKCRSMRINLYLPRKGSLAFSGNRLKFSGMDVSFSGNLRLESGLLRLRLGVAKGVKLEGGYNYWLRFGRKRGKLEVEILDRAEPHSQAKTRLK
ncbi:MAG: AAC(3) family N-acetyltransferase, partial [Candidatus Brockarchaeota archaeon]|nr:AAC(3) family N-acetyltransferase [Candidatus Brockarchaeota archaeon]